MSMIALPFTPVDPRAVAVVPVSALSDWVTVIPAGNSGVVVADTLNQWQFIAKFADVNLTTRQVFSRVQLDSEDRRTPLGTTLRLRLCYEDGFVSSAFPPVTSQLQVRVFAGNPYSETGGLSNSSPLRNLLGDASVVIPADRTRDTEIAAGTSPGGPFYRATTPDNQAHSWDCDGYSFFVVGVERVYACAYQQQAAYLQAKIV